MLTSILTNDRMETPPNILVIVSILGPARGRSRTRPSNDSNGRLPRPLLRFRQSKGPRMHLYPTAIRKFLPLLPRPGQQLHVLLLVTPNLQRRAGRNEFRKLRALARTEFPQPLEVQEVLRGAPPTYPGKVGGAAHRCSIHLLDFLGEASLKYLVRGGLDAVYLERNVRQIYDDGLLLSIYIGGLRGGIFQQLSNKVVRIIRITMLMRLGRRHFGGARAAGTVPVKVQHGQDFAESVIHFRQRRHGGSNSRLGGSARHPREANLVESLVSTFRNVAVRVQFSLGLTPVSQGFSEGTVLAALSDGNIAVAVRGLESDQGLELQFPTTGFYLD
mmetsp:Transcript_12873/g.27762  ORF Transcript_12873/g.27762 Transcript_12873/m.27762 type:complete len:331 (-) Transcript_12873:1026-2018(-)